MERLEKLYIPKVRGEKGTIAHLIKDIQAEYCKHAINKDCDATKACIACLYSPGNFPKFKRWYESK